MFTRTPRIMTVAAALLAMLAMALPGTIGAQDSATPTDQQQGLPHLAFVNVGSCSELGHIVYKLNEIPTDANAPIEAGTSPLATPAGELTAGESQTTLNVSLDDLLADPHAINIHESVEAVDTHIACGDITGTPSGGVLEITLAEQNGSGISGTATLTDNGDDTTDVKLVLGPATEGATPAASPVS
jgi:hypothetical protein